MYKYLIQKLTFNVNMKTNEAEFLKKINFDAKKKEMIFKYKPRILNQYIELKDSPPFEIYFQKQFLRIISKNTIKYSFFKISDKDIDQQILESINAKINNSYESKSELSKNSISNSKNSKKDKKSQKNSGIGYKAKMLEEKLTEKSKEIQEIIEQQEIFLSQIIKENNENEKKSITYDKNNLQGKSFEKYILQFMYDLLNCFSSKDEFQFYNYVKIYKEELNKIFIKYKLYEISDIELDFEIVNLKIKDFIDILIYLYPNYINMENLKIGPFQAKMDFNKLLQMKEKYKDNLECIDIFGEVGVNIITEDEKINQLIKYRKLIYNINYLVNNNKEEAEFILQKLHLSRNNNKVILFITIGDYEKFYERNQSAEIKFLKAQNKYKVNSLLVYIKDNNYSKEVDIINYLIFNNFNPNNTNINSNINLNTFYKNKKKFIDNLAEQKHKNIKQNIINNNYRTVSYQLCDIERRINYIGKEYSLFLKKKRPESDSINNKFVNLFFNEKDTIIQNVDLATKNLFLLKLSGLEKIVTNINQISIIFLHYTQLNININYLQKNIDNSTVFDFKYKNILRYNNDNLFLFSNPEYEKLIQFNKNKNSINFVVFEYDDIYFIPLLNKLCDKLNINYLSYLFIINQKNVRKMDISYFSFFHTKHIYFSNNILQEIIDKFKNIKNQMEKNFSLYTINRVKYNKIIREYNQLYKYEIFNDNDGKKPLDLENNIELYKELFVEKIKQDLAFYLTLSLKDKNKIEITFKSEIIKLIDDESLINDFLENNTLINDFINVMCDFMDVLYENNNDQQFDENFKLDDILTINGVPYIFQSKVENNEKKNDTTTLVENKNKLNDVVNKKEIKNDDGIDLLEEFNFDSGNKIKCKYIQVSLLADDIKDNLKLSLKLINFKLYYKFFMSIVLKSFRDSFLNSIAFLIVENEDKE